MSIEDHLDAQARKIGVYITLLIFFDLIIVFPFVFSNKIGVVFFALLVAAIATIGQGIRLKSKYSATTQMGYLVGRERELFFLFLPIWIIELVLLLVANHLIIS